MDGYNPYAPPTRDPTAPRGGGAPQGIPQDWEIGEVLTAGVNAVKKNPLELIGGFFVVFLLSILPGQVPTVLQLLGVVGADSVIFYALAFIFGLLGALVGAYFWVGEARVALAAVRGEPVDFGMFFSGADRMVPMFVANLLVSLGVACGILLLVVPGIVLAMGWSLSMFLVADAEESPVEAIKSSWELTQGHKMKLFLFFLACTLVVVAGVCACYVGVFVALPVIVIAFADIYRRVTGRMGGEAEAQGAVAF